MIKILTEKRKISIFLFPLVTICSLDAFLWAALFITKSVYSSKVLFFSGMLLVIWTFFFIRDQINKNRENSRTFVTTNIVYACVFSLLLAAFFCSIVWRSGYLSLNPIGAVNEGIQHLDTMFHSSIAESYGYSFLPSSMINDCSQIKYHTLSHFLLGGISRIINIPCFITYNYLYPVIFLPVYLFLQLLAINHVRTHFGTPNMGTVQLYVIYFANIGFFTSGSKLAYGTVRFIGSESFNIALTILFLYIILAFATIDTHESNIKRTILVLCMMILLFFMLWAKISVGFIALAGTMWYLFKIGLKKPKWWICNLGFMAAFVYYYFMFQRIPSMPLQGSSSSFKLFAYADHISSRWGLLGYWLVVSVFSLLFIWFECRADSIKAKDFLTEKTIWMDMIIVCSVIAFLPGAVMDIAGGSAAYFSDVMIPISMVFLCSKDYVDINRDIARPLREVVMVTAFIWLFIGVIDKLPGKPLYHVTAESASMNGLYGELIELREIIGENRWDYIIYLEEDAKAVELFQKDREDDPGLRAAYVYPAITGIGVINATYLRDGKYYTFIDKEVDRRQYCASKVDHDKLTYEEAKKRAKNLGKKHIIHVTKDDYVIEDL